jgi:hypothetical protein
LFKYKFREVQKFSDHINLQLDRPENYLFGPETELMERSQALRELLGNKNPFLIGTKPHDSSKWLAEISEDLHNPDGRYAAFKNEIFPANLFYRPEEGCRIPFCKRLNCENEQIEWDQLVEDMMAYREEVENQPARWHKFCVQNPVACIKSDEFKKIETSKPLMSNRKRQSYQT